MRCVCRNWCNNLFKNPHFIEIHLQHTITVNNFNLLVINQKTDHSKPTDIYICSVDHNVLSSKNLGKAVGIDYPFMSKKCASQLIGSCNGLVCIELYGKICIWNPYTKEYKQVPATPIESPSAVASCIQMSYGFGFDCKIGDYKLLRIVGFADNEVSEARIYTLRSNSWKSLGFIQYDFSWDRNRGHLVNGVLYWIAVARHSESKASCVTVSFDICNETFRDTSLPVNCWINHGMSELGTWEGKLCLVLKHEKDDAAVWTMKDHRLSKHMNITEEIADMVLGNRLNDQRQRSIV
ncbi:F-box/kelch-repeat protein At3g23880-like [Papaver somniferum]|uniref:F-box/kelch-repeat protein At3g23880-like n=1 Tax=Papaver somniferum TaxID=3469 RepID=UPI000E6FCA86|nr:F-box/kelch-repeat protein At3g23880-like [Papaver somniferum]